MRGLREGGRRVSGFRNSGLTEEQYDAREQLWDVAVLIETRWPGEYPVLCRDLRDCGDRIEEEAQDG